jgi:glycosyltransferase involved in cell wall biosynthesis
MKRSATYVVPCFNEARRLDAEAFAALVSDPRLAVIAVDDGSSDDTRAILEAIARSHPDAVELLALERNRGKGEAVRVGMLQALASGAEVVGYADADFATPPSELQRLLGELERRRDVEVLLGARIQRLGADIRRRELRHMAGRIFATVAAWTVGTPVYDTQCGAKLFRRSPTLEAALATPFSSRWSFDVELLARLFGRLSNQGAPPLDPAKVLEVPLEVWHDIGGSQLRLPGMARAFADLLAMWLRTR